VDKKTQALTHKAREKQALEDRFAEKAPPPQGKPFYDDFDSYVKDYPEGERFRNWLTNRGRDSVALFLGTDVGHNAMPGHYLAVTFSVRRDLSMKTCNTEVVRLLLHDNDDGLAIRRWPLEQRAEADKVLSEMKQLAPFDFWDAVKVFEFQRE
jgi:hypothetical protein